MVVGCVVADKGIRDIEDKRDVRGDADNANSGFSFVVSVSALSSLA